MLWVPDGAAAFLKNLPIHAKLGIRAMLNYYHFTEKEMKK
jgi:hypothetical protein